MGVEGKIQNSVIDWLQKHPERNVVELSRLIYPHQATANQLRGIRKAIQTLLAKGLVERSQYYHNGPCYRVTEKARARPDSVKPLKIVR